MKVQFSQERYERVLRTGRLLAFDKEKHQRKMRAVMCQVWAWKKAASGATPLDTGTLMRRAYAQVQVPEEEERPMLPEPVRAIDLH